MTEIAKITFQVSTVYVKSSNATADGYAVATLLKKKNGEFIPETDSAGNPLKDEKGNPIGSYGKPSVMRYGITISKEQYLNWSTRLMEIDDDGVMKKKEDADEIFTALPIYHHKHNPLGTFDVIVSDNVYTDKDGTVRTGLNRYIVTRND